MTRWSWLPARIWPRRGPRKAARERGYDAYVDELSRRLYRQTLGAGGWSVDAGVLGPDHFRSEARRLIHEITLGSAAGGPPSP